MSTFLKRNTRYLWSCSKWRLKLFRRLFPGKKNLVTPNNSEIEQFRLLKKFLANSLLFFHFFSVKVFVFIWYSMIYIVFFCFQDVILHLPGRINFSCSMILYASGLCTYPNLRIEIILNIIHSRLEILLVQLVPYYSIPAWSKLKYFNCVPLFYRKNSPSEFSTSTIAW